MCGVLAERMRTAANTLFTPPPAGEGADVAVTSSGGNPSSSPMPSPVTPPPGHRGSTATPRSSPRLHSQASSLSSDNRSIASPSDAPPLPTNCDGKVFTARQLPWLNDRVKFDRQVLIFFFINSIFFSSYIALDS